MKDRLKQQDKEAKSLTQIISDQNLKLDDLESQNQNLHAQLNQASHGRKDKEAFRKMRKDLSKQMKHMIAQHREENEHYENLV